MVIVKSFVFLFICSVLSDLFLLCLFFNDWYVMLFYAHVQPGCQGFVHTLLLVSLYVCKLVKVLLRISSYVKANMSHYILLLICQLHNVYIVLDMMSLESSLLLLCVHVCCMYAFKRWDCDLCVCVCVGISQA